MIAIIFAAAQLRFVLDRGFGQHKRRQISFCRIGFDPFARIFRTPPQVRFFPHLALDVVTCVPLRFEARPCLCLNTRTLLRLFFQFALSLLLGHTHRVFLGFAIHFVACLALGVVACPPLRFLARHAFGLFARFALSLVFALLGGFGLRRLAFGFFTCAPFGLRAGIHHRLGRDRGEIQIVYVGGSRNGRRQRFGAGRDELFDIALLGELQQHALNVLLGHTAGLGDQLLIIGSAIDQGKNLEQFTGKLARLVLDFKNTFARLGIDRLFVH